MTWYDSEAVLELLTAVDTLLQNMADTDEDEDAEGRRRDDVVAVEVARDAVIRSRKASPTAHHLPRVRAALADKGCVLLSFHYVGRRPGMCDEAILVARTGKENPAHPKVPEYVCWYANLDHEPVSFSNGVYGTRKTADDSFDHRRKV